MAYHIDVLPIGDTQCGEAIAIHIGDINSPDRSKRKVIIIDGGYKSNGDDLVAHIIKHYKTKEVDLVVSTHPDQDHINGLTAVLEQLDVKMLWMHRPWLHSEDIKSLKGMGFNASNVSNKLEKALSSANELEAVAIEQGVEIVEPFVGEAVFDTPYGRLSVVGPTREFYDQLMGEVLAYEPTKASFFSKITQSLSGIFESHTVETLQEGGRTSPQNNSSTVLLLELDNGNRALFAGDAGIDALENAHEELVTTHGHTPGSLKYIQVPHHGSRRNVSPSLLDKLLGTRTAVEGALQGYAVVSVSRDECKQGHPKKVVTNAFKRRGYPVHSTVDGEGKLYMSLGDDREGYSTSESLKHFTYVEPQD